MKHFALIAIAILCVYNFDDVYAAGAHGNVGALGRSASMHASPGDLLSHADIGLMGAAELRRKRFVLTGDMLWMRLACLEHHGLRRRFRRCESRTVRVDLKRRLPRD